MYFRFYIELQNRENTVKTRLMRGIRYNKFHR